MAQNCKHCGEPVYIDRETQKLVDEGFVNKPDICDECLDMINHADHSDESRSDADIGL